jgi:hypothetical protein
MSTCQHLWCESFGDPGDRSLLSKRVHGAANYTRTAPKDQMHQGRVLVM